MTEQSAAKGTSFGFANWKVAVLGGVGVLAASALSVSAAIVVGAGLIAYVIYKTRVTAPTASGAVPATEEPSKSSGENKPVVTARHAGFDILEFAVESYWTSSTNFEGLSDHTRANVRERLLKEGADILGSETPKATNRAHLVDAVLLAARLQALIIDPAPDADPTGMRGQYGISGELRANLVELAKKDEKLKEWLTQFGPMDTFDDAWNPVLVHYWIEMSRVSVLSALRKPLKDWAGRDQPDWLPRYLAVECACAEHDYRKSLGWPSNLGSDPVQAGLEWLSMSIFTNCVADGFDEPFVEWERRRAKIGKKT